MRPNEPRALLDQALAELAASRRHLDYSFRQTAAVARSLEGASEAQLESAEAFAGRFARAVDLLVNKVLRSLDAFELEPEGTLRDVINRAEKRRFVDQAADLREMKMVRNAIVHDYAGAEAAEIFAFCREQKPRFDAVCERVAAYVRNLDEPSPQKSQT